MYLPTPTVVAGYGFQQRLSVCLSNFPHDISKTQGRIIYDAGEAETSGPGPIWPGQPGTTKICKV